MTRAFLVLLAVGGQRCLQYVVRLEGLELGPIRYEAPWVQVHPHGGGALGTFAGLLGAGALLPFARVGVDTERLRLELEPGPELGPELRVPRPGPLLGLSLRPSLAGPRIATVGTGTGAARAGLRPGDLLVAVNGESVRGRSPLEVAPKLWLRPGEKVTLVCLREGRKDPLRVELP